MMYYFIVKLVIRAEIAPRQMTSGVRDTEEVLGVTVNKPVRGGANSSIYSAYNY
jgi:hypothetical protein